MKSARPRRIRRGLQATTTTARSIAVCLLLTAATIAHADPADDYVASQMKEFRLPGLALAVVKDGKVIKAQGYGLANVARKTPVTPDTVLKIGSVSKQFIATGIMLLARDRRLDLDDPISKYLQDAPASWSAITIRHLLTHTAGLVRESPAFDPNKDQTDAVVLKGAYPVALRFSPGQKWEYSNVGYSALAETMTTQVRLTDGSTYPYGFGWHVDNVRGQRRVWHGGGLPGFSAQFVRFPDAGVTIILLVNGDDVDTASIANGLAALHYLPRTNAGK